MHHYGWYHPFYRWIIIPLTCDKTEKEIILFHFISFSWFMINDCCPHCSGLWMKMSCDEFNGNETWLYSSAIDNEPFTTHKYRVVPCDARWNQQKRVKNWPSWMVKNAHSKEWLDRAFFEILFNAFALNQRTPMDSLPPASLSINMCVCDVRALPKEKLHFLSMKL